MTYLDFAVKKNTTVIGGYSKIMKRIEQIGKSIQTFVDLRYGNGQWLENLGYKLSTSHLSFRWVKNDKTYHRMKFRGNTGYDEGMYKLWDCGQAKYVKGRK